MLKIDKQDLTKVLMLLIDNNRLSTTQGDLLKRQKNRQEAIKELLFILQLTTEEAEDMYWQKLQDESH